MAPFPNTTETLTQRIHILEKEATGPKDYYAKFLQNLLIDLFQCHPFLRDFVTEEHLISYRALPRVDDAYGTYDLLLQLLDRFEDYSDRHPDALTEYREVLCNIRNDRQREWERHLERWKSPCNIFELQ